MKVLIVGDKPSRLNKDPNIPFVGARCEKRLREWVKELGLEWKDCKFVNQSDKKFRYELEKCYLMYRPIITLGARAANAVSNDPRYECPVFNLPHPSGLNRQTNDKEFIKNELRDCKNWLNLMLNK